MTKTSRCCLVASDLPSVTCPAQEGGAQTVDRAEIMNQTLEYILLVTTTTLIILKVQQNRDSVLLIEFKEVQHKLMDVTSPW